MDEKLSEFRAAIAVWRDECESDIIYGILDEVIYQFDERFGA
jgi:hypothetical protein